ncbi:glycoside hydrolase family 9 protein [Marinilongibacter aquaticus]|uniref:glycoside hydrolase family 9 protein n=1 Tax=Marinilongibacter aquaticus TaxID=2975157 RepID=UPI0021BD4249|nr:glycoside hydrolase family 9 protein [Marinilongibacter aquaticus]UBM58280.1 glycoside hydrolase family 9 protein [Marinilongibacter aquaticus]
MRIILFVCFVFSFGSHAFGQDVVFRINLAGYPENGPKRALVLCRKNIDIETVELKRIDSQETKALKVERLAHTWAPFESSFELDFSEEKTEGEFVIEIPQLNLRSEQFSIGPYAAWQEDMLGFMQSQRCGFNPYLKVECHQKDGLSFYGKVPDSTLVDARGGWHDAGDQLKYLITGSNATARMLLAYQEYPSQFADGKQADGLPGANGLPDILDEAIWGLDWLFKLHPEADVLYHQVADDRDHHGFKLPQEDNADYGWGKNDYRPVYAATGTPQGLGKYKSKATGLANVAGRSAAAMALAYQIFKDFPEKVDYAKKCLKAAEELYLLGIEKLGYQQGNSFGAPYRYEENTWADDMEWAAAELYKSTGQKRYLKDARVFAKEIGTWSWMERDSANHYEMYPFVNIGHYALWRAGKRKDKALAKAYFAHNLEKIAEKAGKNDYGVGHLFIWCSNNLAAAAATEALLYKKMSGSEQYDKLFQNHVNWLLGLNPWGTSMLTGLPEKADSPEDVHMPFAQILGARIKGSLVDGPISSVIYDNMLGITLSKEDEYADFQPDHIRYHDDFADYSTNEPTMDGTADMLMLMAHLNQH